MEKIRITNTGPFPSGICPSLAQEACKAKQNKKKLCEIKQMGSKLPNNSPIARRGSVRRKERIQAGYASEISTQKR